MRAGDLRHRITIQEQIFSKDARTGEKISAWQDVGTLWAEVDFLEGSENFRTPETHAQQNIKVRMRYCPGITTAMRVKFANDVFYIQSLADLAGRKRELQLICVHNKPLSPGE